MATDKKTDASAGATQAAPEATAPASTTGPQVLRKINPKDLFAGKLKDQPMPSDLFTVAGRAVNLRDGESSFGPWTALVGEFEAINIATGETFISSQCFIPGAAGDLLVAQVRKFVQEEVPVTAEQFKKSGKTYKVTGETVELALIVGIKASDRAGGSGYEFTVRPIVPVQQADSLAHLREKMLATIRGLPKLAAPAASK